MVKVGIIDVSSRFLDGPLVILCEFMNLLVFRHFALALLHGLVLWLRIMPREAALQSLVLGLESAATLLDERVVQVTDIRSIVVCIAENADGGRHVFHHMDHLLASLRYLLLVEHILDLVLIRVYVLHSSSSVNK